MKLKRFPQKLLRKDPREPLPQGTSPLARNPPEYSIGYCWFLYHTGRLWRRLPTLLNHYGFKCLARSNRSSRRRQHRRQRIISVLGIHLHVRTPHPHFDLPVSANALLGRITQGVLIARVSDRPGVGALDVPLRQLAVYRSSSGCRDVFRQNVAVAHQSPRLRQVDPLQPVVYRDRRAFHSHSVHGDVLRQQHLQRIGVAGGRALLPSIAYDEDDLPPGAVTLGKITRRQQDRVIHYARDFWRRANRGHRRSANRETIDHRSLWPERPARHRRSIICSAVPFDLVQSHGQLLPDDGVVGHLADRAAIGVESNFIELAERSLQRRQRFLHLL